MIGEGGYELLDGTASGGAPVDVDGYLDALGGRQHREPWGDGLYYHKGKVRDGSIASLRTIFCIQATLKAENAIRRGIMQAYNA